MYNFGMGILADFSMHDEKDNLAHSHEHTSMFIMICVDTNSPLRKLNSSRAQLYLMFTQNI